MLVCHSALCPRVVLHRYKGGALHHRWRQQPALDHLAVYGEDVPHRALCSISVQPRDEELVGARRVRCHGLDAYSRGLENRRIRGGEVILHSPLIHRRCYAAQGLAGVADQGGIPARAVLEEELVHEPPANDAWQEGQPLDRRQVQVPLAGEVDQVLRGLRGVVGHLDVGVLARHRPPRAVHIVHTLSTLEHHRGCVIASLGVPVRIEGRILSDSHVERRHHGVPVEEHIGAAASGTKEAELLLGVPIFHPSHQQASRRHQLVAGRHRVLHLDGGELRLGRRQLRQRHARHQQFGLRAGARKGDVLAHLRVPLDDECHEGVHLEHLSVGQRRPVDEAVGGPDIDGSDETEACLLLPDFNPAPQRLAHGQLLLLSPPLSLPRLLVLGHLLVGRPALHHPRRRLRNAGAEVLERARRQRQPLAAEQRYRPVGGLVILVPADDATRLAGGVLGAQELETGELFLERGVELEVQLAESPLVEVDGDVGNVDTSVQRLDAAGGLDLGIQLAHRSILTCDRLAPQRLRSGLCARPVDISQGHTACPLGGPRLRRLDFRGLQRVHI
mmetsp:Transcript_44682/g.129129  ORF Transcript_44682/g.129129 Transcript_44682/m.129129 type:complete len:559 (+) Transcript_44682:728-2404(+)